MSNKKIHIDQLFQKLRGYEHPVSSGQYPQVEDKIHDSAWQEKFKGYEHSVSDLPTFETLPFAVKDNQKRGRGVFGILLFTAVAVLISAAWFMVNNYPKKNLPILAKENTDAITAKKVIKKTASQTPINEHSKKSITPEKGYQKATELQKESGKSLASKTKKYDQLQSNIGIAEPVSESKNKKIDFPKTRKTEIKSQLQQKIDVPIKTKKELTESIFSHLPNDLQATDQNLPIWKTIPLAKPRPLPLAAWTITLENAPKLAPIKTKSLPHFYIETGLGNFKAANNTFGGNGLNSTAFFVNYGLNYRKTGLQTGINICNYQFENTIRKILIYDSFPHRGINGDTIGWFKKNPRDTAINENNRSSFTMVSIPLQIHIKVLQINKLNLVFGGGLNLNLIQAKTLWITDNNGYLIDESNNVKKANIGVSLFGRLGYKINGLYEAFGSFAVYNNGTVLKTDKMQASGSQISLGIRYYIR